MKPKPAQEIDDLTLIERSNLWHRTDRHPSPRKLTFATYVKERFRP
jgi:hypothetical protein